MLLTLTTSSLQHYKRAKKPLAISDIPDFVAEELELRGLNLTASDLKGMAATDLEKLRDRADRARCPILVLVEEKPLDFAGDGTLEATLDRIFKLGLAASKLGCPNLAIRATNVTEQTMERAAANIKRALSKLDRHEVHLLLRPGDQLTADPLRLSELIKRIGGFRIGSLPSFAAAAGTGDPEAALRKLAPYAQAVEATVQSFTKTGKHEAWSLEKCLEAIRGVGYQNTVSIDYVGRADPMAAITRARDLLGEVISAGDPA